MDFASLIGLMVVAFFFGGIIINRNLLRKNNPGKVAELTRQISQLEIERTRLEKEVNKGIFDILAIYEFTSVLGSITNLKELYSMLVDTILRIIHYDACSILVTNPETNELEIAISRGLAPEIVANYETTCVDKGIISRVMQRGQPEIINDLHSLPWPDNIYEGFPYNSILSIPLVIHGEILGFLTLYLRQKNGFKRDDLRILFIIANQTAFAIKNGYLYEKVAEQATLDGLTGLYNYRVFREQIEKAVARAQREQSSVAMIMIDVDDFKSVNDCYGHQRGDAVLRAMAKKLQSSIRDIDMVARYGGEEFAVILPNTELEEAVAIANRIHQAIGAQELAGLQITISLGVAVYPGSDVASADDLVCKADTFAYQAKFLGKNQVYY